MGKYKYIKMIIFILGLFGMIGGTLVSAMTIRSDSEAIDFVIDAETVRKYGHFNDITTEATITGTILKPIDDLDEDEKRPCVFLFHGMFLNRFMQLQTGIYFAKAGMYVITVDQSGQGESTGLYRLGPEIEALGKTVIDYFIDEGFEEYDMNVDLDALGVNGHSYGGIASTYAGINRPDKLKAVAAIWTWTDLSQTIADITMGLDQYDFDEFLDSPIYQFLTKLTGFGDALYYNDEGDYSTDKEDIKDFVEERNTVHRVNFTVYTPPNYLLITAQDDELITPEQQIEIMAKASWNYSGGMIYKDFYDEIDEAIDKKERWTNVDHANPNYTGNFDDKTARRLYLPEKAQPSGHGMEGFTVEAYTEILEWFGDAFNWDVKDVVDELEETGVENENVDGTLPMLALLKWAGWIVSLLALLLAFPAIVSYLVRYLKFKNSEKEYQVFISAITESESERFKEIDMKYVGGLLGIYLAAEFLAIFLIFLLGITPKMLGIPYIIADALIMVLFGKFLIVAPLTIIIFIQIFKKTNVSIEDLGIPNNKAGLIKDIMLGILIALIFFIVYNLIAVISVSPRLLPRRSPSIGYIGFILLAIYFLLFFFFDELIFRSVVQKKLHNSIYNKMVRVPNWIKKWIEYIIIVILQIAILMTGVYVGLIIAMGGVPPYLVFGFMFMGASLAFIPIFMNAYIYQRTKSIIIGIVSSALIMAFILGGSIVGAITF